MMISFIIWRKGATKSISCSAPKDSYLSLAQIFESTSDVVSYRVTESLSNFTHKDLYLPDNHGFPKWLRIE